MRGRKVSLIIYREGESKRKVDMAIFMQTVFSLKIACQGRGID